MNISNAIRSLAAIVLVLSFLALPAPVAADTTTLRPDAAGTYQAWSIFGGSPTHWQATSDQSDATGVQITGDTTSRETEDLQNTSQTGTINSVTAYMRAKATGTLLAQVQYIAAGTGSGTTGNPTPAYPSGLQANDLILLQVTVRDTSTTPTTPSGFTLLYGPDSTTTGRQWIYYRFSNGTESGTITVSIGGSTCKIARMYAFRNVALSSFTEDGGFGSGTGATISAQTVATTGIRRLAVSFVFVNDDNTLGNFTGETGGDWVSAATFTTTSGYDGAVQLQTATMASDGTISGGSYNMGASDPWGVRAFALIPTVPTTPAGQVTFVAAGTGSGTTGNPTPAYPSGLQANDLILLQVTVRDTSTTPTTPSGFTLLYGPDSTTTGRQWIYYRFSNGTESGTITVSIGGSTCKIARMYAFRNVALSSFTEGGGFGSGTGATISAQTVATTGIRRLAVSFVFVNDDNTLGNFTGETGGDWVSAATFTTTSGSDGAVQLQTATMASDGTISGGSYNMGASDPWGVRAFALIPIDPEEQAVILWRTYDTDYESSARTVSRAAFTNYSETRATNPNTGSAWTWSEVNALQIGSRASTLEAGETIQCAEYWIVVDYSPFPIPNADFTASPTSGCAPLEVTFTDASTGSPTSWSWSFPGGNPSTASGQGPHTVIYNSAGSYNVSLTASNAYGEDTENKPNYITVNQTPIVTISGNPNICGAGNSTTLTANVTGGTQPYAYDWSLSTAPGSPNNNTYTATGAGTVAVAVTDNLGCTGRAKTTVAVKSPPDVNLSGNLIFCEGSSTTITAIPSGGTPPYTYDWSASTAPGSYQDNEYTATGSGTVAVTVTDSAICRGVVISDTNTLVTQGNVPGTSHPYNAVPAWVHGSWWGGLTGYTFDYSLTHTNTAAQWIWESYHPVHPIDGDIVYFQRSFNIPGTPISANIYMTCDNGYEVYINGNYLGRAQCIEGWETSDLREPWVEGDGWQSVETWLVTADLLNSGTNVLLAKAANEQLDGGTPTGNPGGLLYEVVYEYNAEPNVCGCTASDSVVVTMNPAPEATASSNSPVAEGATIELYGGPNGMSQYSWSGPNSFSSPFQNPTIPSATTAMTGNYTLTVTDGNGCQGEAITYVEVTAVPIIDTEIYDNQDCSGLPVTSMDPQTLYYARATVTLSNNLSNLQTVRIILFYDSAGTNPLLTEPVTADTQTCAILTCTVGTPPTWSIEPNNIFPNPPDNTTWAIVSPACIQPSLNATSGDWIFAFRPGKVATEAPSLSQPNTDWDVQGKATNNNNQSGEIYVRDKAMNWYGEITVPASVDWGEVPLGLTFEDLIYNPVTLSINYIANGNYYEDISTAEYWTGDGETVTLDASGGNPPTDPTKFALMADNTDNPASAIIVTTQFKHINASGVITGEAGVDVDTNSLWLSLSERDVAAVVYSGSIYYQIDKFQ